MDKEHSACLDHESLLQLSNEQLVDVIVEQVLVIQGLKKTILELEPEIQRLKVSRDLDSQTSSKPPSGDILKKSEKKDSEEVNSGKPENGEIEPHTEFALFHVADTRSPAELEKILGLNYIGVLSSDDYSVYNGYGFVTS